MPDLYLYSDSNHERCGHLSAPELNQVTERHKISLQIPTLEPTIDPLREARRKGVAGLVIEVYGGAPTHINLDLAQTVLRQGRKVFLYWPGENAVELVDEERLRSYRRLSLALSGFRLVQPLIQQIRPASTNETVQRDLKDCMAELTAIANRAKPLPMRSMQKTADGDFRFSGTGVYLRTDFFAKISSGGSYGHTCYVANALNRMSDSFVCLLAHPYSLLDDLQVRQMALPELEYKNEFSLVAANSRYRQFLWETFQQLRPSFIYERLCLGNYCGARLSQDFEVPYIVEYNGSEIVMKRTFDGSGYLYEDIYLAAEEAAFRQATLISVVSDAVKEDLINRGVPGSKIVVSPNGVDPEHYKPLPAEQRNRLRQEMGWNESHRVVGFTGTFGGWHGIDVLAEAIPEVCRRVPEARFLLVGDGNYKSLVDTAVRKHGLLERVHSSGRVPQSEGARLLGACDVYVSPHNRHMINGRFFGSPTKIFEYMSMGGGIVASELEQIGEVLSPPVRASELAQKEITVSNQRSVLCQPGNLNQFVDGIEYLLRRPTVCTQLGKNARRAVIENYTWDHNVRRLCKAMVQNGTPEETSGGNLQLSSEDAYKKETQAQWDNDPCGSHYVKEAQPHTLEWFREVERYRYVDYAPWMPELMEFDKHGDEKVLEIGGGIGTDLAQFARHGAHATDIDLSQGHLKLAEENFRLRGLQGQFIHQDAETLPFADKTFDLVYSNGVIHHTPNTARLVSEMLRVMRPGGRAIVMVYAENSWHYWFQLVFRLGMLQGLLENISIGEIMSRNVELTETGARPLVKVYTKKRLENLFKGFSDIQIYQQQLTRPELPRIIRSVVSMETAGKMMGWNLIIKAKKP